jgi:hypothetical protein
MWAPSLASLASASAALAARGKSGYVALVSILRGVETHGDVPCGVTTSEGIVRRPTTMSGVAW